MWEMMRLSPFGGMAGFPGSAQGLPPSLSAMSDLMAPLASVEELDKRITDLRAVEQWLKLNLNMLQSAIQALEVQRATLATLRAFGALAQSSMEAAEAAVAGAEAGVTPPPAASAEIPAGAAPESSASGPAPEGFDPSGWWNLLQSQFNQLASFAMTQPGAAVPNPAPAPGKDAAPKPAAARRAASPRPAAAAEPRAEGARAAPRAAKKAAKRSA